ncbi:MAG: hypothetical protein NT025_09490, partial [bacterium]|nr:hypothetical protein [bacterium]
MTAPVVVPAGVDTSVAVSATIAAREVLVGYQEDSLAGVYRQQAEAQYGQGEPLLKAFRLSRQPAQSVAPSDTAAGYEYGLKGDGERTRAQRTLGNVQSSLDASEAKRQQAAPFLEAARDDYERALQLNPWDATSRWNLARTYTDLADIHQSLADYDQAISAIQKYLLLEGDVHWMLSLMAQCYMSKGDTLRALLSFRRAEDCLMTWHGVRTDTLTAALTTQDTQDWVWYVGWQYACEATLGLSESAMNDLERMVAICEAVGDTAKLRTAKEDLEALSWDNGSMQSLSLRKRYLEEYGKGNVEDARQILNSLLSILEAPGAIFDTRFDAAKLDILLREYEPGLLGMRRLLNEQGFVEVDSCLDSLLLKNGRDGFVQRLLRQKEQANKRVADLIDSYGRACLQYGVELEEKRKERERTYIYYYQSALVPWPKQARALAYLADLSKNQPERAVRYGEAALAPELDQGLSSQ